MNSPLRIVKELFDKVEQEDIRYCFWKGNQHLAESLAGHSDLDLLVDEVQATQFEQILLDLGFKRFISQPWSKFPGIEDWIGFDSQTGRLIHIHLYYQLLMGTKFVNEYHLPWEMRILDSAIRDPDSKLRISNPNLELIVLYVRLGLDNSLSKLIAVLPGQRAFEKDFKSKISYLNANMAPDSVMEFAISLLGSDYGQQIGEIITDQGLQFQEVKIRLKPVVRTALHQYRRYGKVKELGQFSIHTIQFLESRARRKLKMNSQTGKRMQNEGAVIAFIGSDGSGKSTISSELQKWLAWKIDAHQIYLGSGDGSIDLPVKILKALASKSSFDSTGKKTSRKNLVIAHRKREPSLIKETASCLLDLSITNQRYRKVKEAGQARTRGSILITDRYPQNQFVGIYDGPRVSRKNSGSSVRQFFSRLEQEKYNEISKVNPDIVFKLHVPVEVALKRKPNHDVENIKQKAEITSQLGFSRSKVIDIDASRPVEEVLSAVKQGVWESI